MTKISRVLAAVDFSKPARRAFEHALALSEQYGAELIVVHAVPTDQAFRWHGRDRMSLIGRLRRKAHQAHVAFRHRIQQGDPAKVILLHAAALAPDLIVMGTHQRTGLDRIRAGSVGARVATGARVPVLLVPHERDDKPIRPFSHLAVAVDFSASSDRAVEEAFALATDADDRVTLLHVVPGFAGGVPPRLHRYGAAEYQSQLIADGRRRLQLAAAGRHTPAAVHARVLVGDTSTAINRVVERIDADLLVVGVPERSAVSRALVGTTAGRLLKQSGVPMLAVPEARAGMDDRATAAASLAA